MALPSMEGWSWATLNGVIDLGELEELLIRATRDASSPGLALSVHDSDLAYLAGADETGIRFRLVVNAQGVEDKLPHQDIVEAVAWSTEHARLELSASDVAEVLERRFVLAEEGVDLLFARMGLISTDQNWSASEIDASPVDLWLTLEPVDAPEKQILEGGRWHATFEHGAVSACVVAAEEPPSPWVSAYGARRGAPIVHFGKAETKEELWSEATRQGITLGHWEEVPEGVSRNLASTCAWVLRG